MTTYITSQSNNLYQKMPIISKLYNYVEKTHDKTKKGNNELFTKYIKKHKLFDGNAIVLDGESMKSTKALHKINIRGGIYVPEIDQDTHKIHEESELCVAVEGKIGDFIRYSKNKKIILKTDKVFFDYMTDIDGNKAKNIYPMKDIAYFLTHTKAKKLALAFTFPQRLAKGLGYYDSAVDKIDSYIKDCIADNGYEIIDGVDTFSYHRDRLQNEKKTADMTMAVHIIQKIS